MTIAAPTLLDDRRVFDTFDCGVLALDEWLKRRARTNAKGGASRTHVA